MGHERFYHSLLVAMGNVVSALFMYVLQAAWLCQRLIDQDYRQNHGSRLKPLVDCKDTSEPVEIVSEWTVGHKRHPPRPRKLDMTRHQVESPRRHGDKRRRYGHRSRGETNPLERRLNSSHPYLETSDSIATTVEYVNRLGHNLALRRAFSDINISSSCSEMKHFDDNQNYLSSGNTDDISTVSVTDQNFLRASRQNQLEWIRRKCFSSTDGDNSETVSEFFRSGIPSPSSNSSQFTSLTTAWNRPFEVSLP